MEKKRTEAMADDPSEYDYCAGMLLFTRVNNNIYFLLGKARRHGRLVTFSGKNEVCDSSIAETAARECYEETLGCVASRSWLLSECNSCVESRIVRSTTPRGRPCHTFVVSVPYSRCYALSFHRTSEFVSMLGHRSSATREMVDVRWVGARALFGRIRDEWKKYRLNADNDQWAKIALVCGHSDESPWRRVDGRCDNEDWRAAPRSVVVADADM